MSGCEKSPLVSAFAGGVGGIAAAFATCPLEVIKTRLQSSLVTSLPDNATSSSSSSSSAAASSYATKSGRPLGTFGLGLHIVRTEGFRALYKGMNNFTRWVMKPDTYFTNRY